MAERQRSSISFPYSDLGDAEEVAFAIHRDHGNACSLDQLAASLGHDTINSGTFRGRVSGAGTFGVIRSDRKSVRLTDLGTQIVDPATRDRARVDAFLRVPLYKAVYDNYRGRMLPGDQGLESFMAQQGVTPKQTAKARQSFQRSARQAGFFRSGQDRLVEPPLRGQPSTVTEVEPSQPEATVTTSIQQGYTFGDPLIEGLVQRLPKKGETFTSAQIEKWIALAKNILEAAFLSDQDQDSGPKKTG